MPIFLVHVFILGFASFATAKRVLSHRLDQLIGATLLFWANIVVTCLGLSLLGELDDFRWLLRGSLLLAGITFLLVRRCPPAAAAEPADTSTPHPLLFLAAGLTLVLALAANVSIAAAYAPSNYDSLTYHLPRTAYYLGQGSLAHFATADFRQVYYPYNFNLLQLLGFAYHAPAPTLTFFNVAAWLLTGLSVYRTAQLAGYSANASFAAAWFLLTSLEVLAQATSTTLDLPCGAALAAAVSFALRWRITQQHRDALFAGVALSMSLGTKLIAIFFIPAFGVLLLVIAWHFWRRGARDVFFRRVGHWIAPAALSIPLGASFLFYNYAATGELMTNRMDFTLNKPFEWGCAVHTAKAYLVQIFAEPMARLTFDIEQIHTLNQWFAAHVFANWNPAYVFSPLFTIPPDLNEDHVFFGYAGPLLLICAVVCLARDWRLQRPVTWMAFVGLGWFAAYFAYNKWSLYNQRYFVPPMILLAPCIAAVLDAGWSGPGALRKIKRFLFLAVTAIAAWSGGYYLLKNSIRPVPLPGTSRPNPLPTLPPQLAESLAGQPWVNVDSYGTNERVYPLMLASPASQFTSGPVIDPARFHLFSFWKATRNFIFSNLVYPASYTVFPFPGKRTAGVEFLGTIEEKMADSFDYVGLPSHAADLPATPANANVLVIVEYNANSSDPIRLGNGRVRVVGLNPTDGVVAHVFTERADGSREPLFQADHHDWVRISVQQPFQRLVVELRDRTTQQVVAEGEIPFTVRKSDLLVAPQISENTLYSRQLVTNESIWGLTLEGLSSAEGPYPQWDLPLLRWAKQPTVKITLPPDPKLRTIRVFFSTRLQVREESTLEIRHNGVPLQHFILTGSTTWLDQTVDIQAAPGINVVELIDRSSNESPDWLGYLDKNPDVKSYVLAQSETPPEKAAEEHYRIHGRAEGRQLPLRRRGGATPAPPPESLYYLYRSLRIDGLSGQ